MDDNFAYFLKKMGPAIDKRLVPPSSIERYRGRLPDQLLAYWNEHGWCAYADGLFWTVDPLDYAPALAAWIDDTPFMEQDAYHVIARSAFGDLYLWGENTGHSLQVVTSGSFCIPRVSRFVGEKMNFGVQVFFGSVRRDDNDFEGLFDPAVKKLGRLQHDEMYGFVPALALGGAATVDHLHRVKAVDHLVLLAQLAPLTVLANTPNPARP